MRMSGIPVQWLHFCQHQATVTCRHQQQQTTPMRSRFSCSCQGQQQSFSRSLILWPSQLQRSVAGRKSGSRSKIRSKAVDGLDGSDFKQLLGQSYLRPEYEELSDEHVNDLVEAAAGLISVIDDLRPLDPDSYNPFYEIYKVIAAVPPSDRVRILDELEPGALYSLWRASVGQYVLDTQRKEEIFKDHVIWDDFPTQPGQVVTYQGLCEQFKYEKQAGNPADSPINRTRDPRLKPWLKPNPTTMATPQERFKQQFFVAKRTGLLHSRLLLDLGPLAGLLTPPIYNRVEIGLSLTPVPSDAGADACIVYPFDPALLQQRLAAGVALNAADLPSQTWPAPSLTPAWSPLSFTERDYIRVAGPGFYVGCGYRKGEKGELLDDEHVYFALVKTG